MPTTTEVLPGGEGPAVRPVSGPPGSDVRPGLGGEGSVRASEKSVRAWERDGDADSRALGCVGRATTGRKASARTAPADAAWEGPADVADLPAVQARLVRSGR